MSRPPVPLTDGQARAVILAAEAHGFEREPGRYVRWYDADLHDDAASATEFLHAHARDTLEAASVAPDPLTPEQAARRIAAKGIDLAAMGEVVAAATQRGFVVPQADLWLPPTTREYNEGTAAIEFLWKTAPETLQLILGEHVLLAPIPNTAAWPCRCFPRSDADYY